MNLRSTFARPTGSLMAGVFFVALASVAVGWAAGTVAASNGSKTGTAPTTAPLNAPGADLGASGMGSLSTVPQYAGGTSGTAGTAASIAYPIPGYGSLGVAPEGTILAQGTGTSTMKADGSDRTAALKKATDSALADARASALAAATSMGVGLKEIYSVSIISTDSFTYPTPECVIAPLMPGLDGGASTGSVGAVPASPPAVCIQKGTLTPTSAQLVVTLVVAFKFA